MQHAGILILSLLFLGAGGMLGSACAELLHGHFRCVFSDAIPPIPFWFTMIANPLCWLCIWLLRRRLKRQAPLQAGDNRLRFGILAVRGLPVTDRIGFLAFTILWTFG